MASQDDSDHGSQHPEQAEQPAGKREPISPASRKRLQKCFDYANKQMAQENYDYANDLFTQCVVGDPGNLTYARSYIGNLQKKYKNNKKGSSLAQFKERGARSAAKKALSQSQWDDVIKHGVVVLKVNPWDVPTLTAMASACEGAGYLDCELFYLKCALDPNPKDPDVNRLYGIALGKRSMFDQAIAAWHRVEQARPDDEEAKRAIASLAVEKTITKIDNPELQKARAAAKGGAAGQPAQEEAAPDERLRKKIAREPNDLPSYMELATIYLNSDRYQEAEEVLLRACKISNNDPDVEEKLVDAQLRILRQGQIAVEKRVRESGDEEAKAEYKRIRKEIVRKELGLWKKRCDRYPNNLNFKYELGLRYEMNGEFSEAIKEFQVAKNDPRRKGFCMLELGKCFERIKQYRLAMTHYDSAIQDIPDREADSKKEALHRAGKLAFVLKDLDSAEKHLSALAALDFAFKDVSELLDKISHLRDDSGSASESGSPSEEPTA